MNWHHLSKRTLGQQGLSQHLFIFKKEKVWLRLNTYRGEKSFPTDIKISPIENIFNTIFNKKFKATESNQDSHEKVELFTGSLHEATFIGFQMKG